MAAGPGPHVRQVPRLTPEQVAHFVREGYVVLPAALDPSACAAVEDEMWAILATELPRLRRHEPSSWGAFAPEERSYRRPDHNDSYPGGDPLCVADMDHRFITKNEQLGGSALLDAHPRALWDVAQQLLGEGEVVYPAGLGPDGKFSGPVFYDDQAESMVVKHADIPPGDPRSPGPATFRTETVAFGPRGPALITGQSTRGLYCMLPGNLGPSSCHTDGGQDSRVRLRATAFIADCPEGSGGWCGWPRSHVPIWEQRWRQMQEANLRQAERGGG